MFNMDFYAGKKVLVTGHTGFKGSWICQILANANAEVTGYGLLETSKNKLFLLSGVEKRIHSVIGDIRNFKKLKHTFDDVNPEIVIHLAAQPIVRDGYKKPLYTYETNVLGTVNLLECVRESNCVKSILNVTTDKVYENSEKNLGYRESDPLDGFDPYSNSKSCSELVTHSYWNSFFSERCIPISTARAGNVIGGGDFANERIIPDCVRAVMAKETIKVRNPDSIRPYQHVLEPLFAYLMIIEGQYHDIKKSGWYNVGPNDENCVTTSVLVDMFCNAWKENSCWEGQSLAGPHEANFLKLDCSKIKSVFGWHPYWNIKYAVDKTCEWYKAWLEGKNVAFEMDKQIIEYWAKYQ